MLKVIIKTNPGFKILMENVNDLQKLATEESNNLGRATAEKMKEVIATNKVRPQAGEPTDLENGIDVEIFPNNEGWGVGNIDKLNADENTKGWRATNYGSSHTVGLQLPKGVFDPGEPAPNGAFFRKGRFKKGEEYNDESYAPIMKKPIPAMNYIEKTVNWLQNEINTFIDKVTRR